MNKSKLLALGNRKFLESPLSKSHGNMKYKARNMLLKPLIEHDKYQEDAFNATIHMDSEQMFQTSKTLLKNILKIGGIDYTNKVYNEFTLTNLTKPVKLTFVTPDVSVNSNPFYIYMDGSTIRWECSYSRIKSPTRSIGEQLRGVAGRFYNESSPRDYIMESTPRVRDEVIEYAMAPDSIVQAPQREEEYTRPDICSCLDCRDGNHCSVNGCPGCARNR